MPSLPYQLSPGTMCCAHVLFHLAKETARIKWLVKNMISDWKYFCNRKLKKIGTASYKESKWESIESNKWKGRFLFLVENCSSLTRLHTVLNTLFSQSLWRWLQPMFLWITVLNSIDFQDNFHRHCLFLSLVTSILFCCKACL